MFHPLYFRAKVRYVRNARSSLGTSGRGGRADAQRKQLELVLQSDYGLIGCACIILVRPDSQTFLVETSYLAKPES
jgi:hypothetical protein